MSAAVIIQCAVLAGLALVGAIAAGIGRSQAARGAQMATQWAHPSLSDDPDKAIRHARRGAEVARRGLHLAVAGATLALLSAGIALATVVTIVLAPHP